MENHEKIRRCPHCAQLVHFENGHGWQRCWRCGSVSDFSQVKTGVEKLGFTFDVLVGRAMPTIAHGAKNGSIALLVTAPWAALMLLLCQSFHLTIVYAPLRNLLMP